MNSLPRRTFVQWCRRYLSVSLLVVVGVLVYILVFSDNNVSETYTYERKIDSLKAGIKQAEDSLAYYQNLKERLHTDPVTMEQVVRENYHMQRPDEDVFVVQ